MTIAAVLMLDRHDANTEDRIRRLAVSGTPLTVVAYAGADRAAVAGCCSRLQTIFVAAAPGATFGAAANAGAASAPPNDALAFIDGAEPLAADWSRPLGAALASAGGGVAGPRILTTGGTVAECGQFLSPAPLTLRGFSLRSFTNVLRRIAVDAVPRDCLLTAHSTFIELGGFSAAFGAASTVLDYCLRVSASGRGVIFDPDASFARHEEVPALETELQARRERAFAEVWRERAEPHDNLWPELTNAIVRRTFHSFGTMVERIPIPMYRVLVHGANAPAPEFADAIVRSRMSPAAVLWAAPGAVPPGAQACTDAVAAARNLTEVRNWDGVAFVRSDTALTREWLNELVNAIEAAPASCAATIAGPDAPPAMPASADARCTLIAPRLIPQHLRIDANAPSLDAGLTAWLGQAVDAGLNIARVRRTASVPGPAAAAIPPATAVSPTPPAAFASIVMLSWNAPEFTERAVASIRAHTRVPHEIIIVDNGSSAATVARVRALADVRLIENAVNTGFSFACNQGLAAGRGTHLVLLNNDVIVTDGWLEALIAVQRRNPTVGCSAPRTNRIAGLQQIDAVPYGDDLSGLAAFAAQRAREFRGRWTSEFRVVGFCMCLDRRVVDEIGGLDPRYGVGNFEDDDYSMRIRAAGYDIAVCEDAFIHHFGSVSFVTNDVDYNATFERNKALFARRWNVPFNGNSYDGRYPFRRGFRRERDFVPLPAPAGVSADWTAPV
jgi:GT2 family glycosyltransferase